MYVFPHLILFKSANNNKKKEILVMMPFLEKQTYIHIQGLKKEKAFKDAVVKFISN